jgi:hypothetical protein
MPRPVRVAFWEGIRARLATEEAGLVGRWLVSPVGRGAGGAVWG